MHHATNGCGSKKCTQKNLVGKRKMIKTCGPQGFSSGPMAKWRMHCKKNFGLSEAKDLLWRWIQSIVTWLIYIAFFYIVCDRPPTCITCFDNRKVKQESPPTSSYPANIFKTLILILQTLCDNQALSNHQPGRLSRVTSCHGCRAGTSQQSSAPSIASRGNLLQTFSQCDPVFLHSRLQHNPAKGWYNCSQYFTIGQKEMTKKSSLRGIPTMIFSDTVSGINSDILSDKKSDILPDIHSDILSGISSDTVSGITSNILFRIGWHSIWRRFRHSTSHKFWPSISHVFWHSICHNWHSIWQNPDSLFDKKIWHSIWHLFWHSIYLT